MFVRLRFSLHDQPFGVEVPLPEQDVLPEELLPAANDVLAAIVGRGVEDGGLPVSCRRGCGACCRQVVPISQPEARHLTALVEALPEPRRAAVRDRFARAHQQLADSGLAERIAHPGKLDDAERQSLAIDYFRLGIACPFLDNEECSIYPDRPLVCREYLVTTPAEHCARPGYATVTRVGIAGRVSVAMGQLEPVTDERSVWWLPLVSALAWSAAQPSDQRPARRNPVELLRALVDWLKRT